MVSNALLFILSYMKYYFYPGMFVFTSDQMVHACLTARAFIISVLCFVPTTVPLHCLLCKVLGNNFFLAVQCFSGVCIEVAALFRTLLLLLLFLVLNIYLAGFFSL